jgi:hypothetical protein
MSTKDAAAVLGVAPATLRGDITKGVLPEAPFFRVGLRMQRGFTSTYLDVAAGVLGQGGRRPL